jgi:hypothetical protein|tara:strand:- start:656 stop:889 length:234 start_codon:yes stop_codon:yes gene_type:complete
MEQYKVINVYKENPAFTGEVYAQPAFYGLDRYDESFDWDNNHLYTYENAKRMMDESDDDPYWDMMMVKLETLVEETA